MALAVAALLTVGKAWCRITAAALTVLAFGIGAGKMLTDSGFELPWFADAARYIEQGPAVVAVDGAALTPGPLTNFDFSLDPAIPDLRLYVPEEKDHPFEVGDIYPVPQQVIDEAVATADGGPIAIAAGVRPTSLEQLEEWLPEGMS